MNRPYIVCHMMASVDGRIDCAMTEKMKGVNEYYETLSELNAPTTLSGRVTAQLEMAEPGTFHPQSTDLLGAESFSKKTDADGYCIAVDTKGSLLWKDETESEMPLIIITSEQVTKEYLAYLDSKNISWIACGKKKIDLARAVELLSKEFGVERMAIVGGASINAGFLEAGLLDEVSILFAPGIDGRGGMAAVFDGLPMNQEPVPLKLTGVTPYDNGAVWLQYQIEG